MPNETIPFDRMLEQIEKNLYKLTELSNGFDVLEHPEISFEKGVSQIRFNLPPLTDSMLFLFVSIIKKYIHHIRVLSFEDSHYAVQALNKNLYNTENITDNIKFEFFSLMSSRGIISKKGNFSQEEINCTIEIFKSLYSIQKENPVTRLKKLGASILSDNNLLTWDYLAGYDDVKRKIKESILLPLQNSEVYDSVAKMTRKIFESNRPRAILFEGGPGVGKTTLARIIAGEAKIPLIYVPIESIMSKWFGESSKNLSEIFDASEDLGGAIIFIDEIDSLAGSRDQNMFEATRRVLSVLLRKLDGIDSMTNTITIGATNRQNDLDHALISRFDQTIHFPSPNSKERAAIFHNYAKHLTEEELKTIGEISKNFTGRNIKDVCELTERRWSRKIIIQKQEPSAPPFEYYKQTIGMWINKK